MTGSESEEDCMEFYKKSIENIAERQENIIKDVAALKVDLEELNTSVKEVVTLFKDGKSVIRFLPQSRNV